MHLLLGVWNTCGRVALGAISILTRPCSTHGLRMDLDQRGAEEWNISVTNEVRSGSKGTIGIISGMGIAHLIETIFAQEKNIKTNEIISY